MSKHVLLANLNRHNRAQDLWVQSLAECDGGLGVATEPSSVPNHSQWLGDTSGSVVIVHRGSVEGPFSSFSSLGRGRGFVVAKWGDFIVVGCYISPNKVLQEVERVLEDIGVWVARFQGSPVLVLGDFNAKSAEWGSPRTDERGHAVGDWAASLELHVANRGSRPTCMRRNGASIVDLTFVSSQALNRVTEWEVLGEETLSDHAYVRMAVSPPEGTRRRRPGDSPKKWVLSRLNDDALRAAALTAIWSSEARPVEVEGMAAWFRETMSQVCDAAMPRAKSSPPGRNRAYWWSREIANMRHACVAARRQYARTRRRKNRGDSDEEEALYRAYREKQAALRTAIKQAKTRAWEELLGTLNRDPWGRPYRMVLGRIRPWTPPTTATLDPQFLRDVVSALFPAGCGRGARRANAAPVQINWTEDLEVSEQELREATRKMCRKSTAPGPDGVPGRVWAVALEILGDRLRQLFSDCLRSGKFPQDWKKARLVLLPKEGRPPDTPSAFRPICLLDEAGKLFERIVVARLSRHLSGMGPDLSKNQYGFREGHSTVDAIRRVRTLVEAQVSRGGVALAISFDIANAFNTLPWGSIGKALEKHQVPPYLQAVISDYLRDRWLIFPGQDGKTQRREVHRGVPQGSVLGPCLWNLGYNSVLRRGLPAGIALVCYADDTLMVAWGRDWQEARLRAEDGARRVIRRIREVGLEVALHKTEALWFHGLRSKPPRFVLKVGEARIRAGNSLKYLGLTLDGLWTFREHFSRLAPRLEGVASGLARLLPNLGGPDYRVRRLYVGVVLSMALYGAPVWAGDLHSRSAHAINRRSREIIARVLRRVAIRVARGYRTISREVAGIIAGIPPFDVLAEMYALTFDQGRALRQENRGEDEEEGGVSIAARELAIRRNARRAMLLKWKRRMEERASSANQRLVRAVLSHLEEWQDRRHGKPTFRLTQVLSGHGCFGEYLSRIEREESAACKHCGAERDTAQHTLEVCCAWAEERRVLKDAIGEDLALSSVVQAMLADEASWRAVAFFCERVMQQKEDAERERERERAPNSSRIRRKRRGRGIAPRGGTHGPPPNKRPRGGRGVPPSTSSQ